MKNEILKIATTLALTLAITAPVMANEKLEKITMTSNTTMNNMGNITPFNLVHSSYQGQFKQQGIPSYSGLLTATKSGEVDAESLVKVAIDQGRLDPSYMENSSYLSHVQFILEHLERN